MKRVVLVALGITAEDKKEVTDFWVSCGESQQAWEGFLNDLYSRGLDGEGLEMIVKDGAKGLLAALSLVYPHVAIQRFWAHKSRNVLSYVRKVDHEGGPKGPWAGSLSAGGGNTPRQCVS